MTCGSNQRIPRECRGSAMLAALCLTMVFAISLSSYLALCYENLYISERNTMTSFRGSELAEAGVEQALYCLNNNVWTGWNLSGGTMSATMTMTSSGLSTTKSTTLPTRRRSWHQINRMLELESARKPKDQGQGEGVEG